MRRGRGCDGECDGECDGDCDGEGDLEEVKRKMSDFDVHAACLYNSR